MNYLMNKEKFVSCAGSSIKEEFHGQVQADGSIKLISDGFMNLQEYIDSFEEEADIHNIIERVAAGEVDLLNQKQGQFIDTIGMPKTYAEVLNLVNDGKRTFEMLPKEIKEKFDNDFNKWFVSMEDDDFLLKSGFVKEVEKQESEVKTEE